MQIPSTTDLELKHFLCFISWDLKNIGRKCQETNLVENAKETIIFSCLGALV